MERLGIIMKFLDAEFVQGFIRMADDGWQQGWHERNGGNLSYRVKPEEVDALAIEPGQDLCTLVTCTPYGINSHRLLVRGHRVETSLAQLSVRISADALVIDPYIVAPIVAAPMLLILLILMLVTTSPKHKKRKGAERS